MSEQIVTSIRVDRKLWKQAKIYAVKHDTTVAALLEKLLRQQLQKEE